MQSVICGKNGYVYAGTITGGIFRSTDGGVTFPDNSVNTLTIVSLAVDRFNSNIIYAGASSGSPPNYGFYRSTDAGTTWSSNLNPLNIWGIVQNNLGHLFSITTSSPYSFDKSTNGGLNWTSVSNLTGAMRGLCLSFSGFEFYTSGNGGVFKSTNGGTGFVNFNLTYSSNQILSSSFWVYVAVSGTTNGGVYIYFDNPFGIKQATNKVPVKFELFQNYPNPFNPVTKIRFDITEGFQYAEPVQLIIYDINGKEAEILINEHVNPGEYEVSWNASYYPSGVYFYTLRAGNFTVTRKMILIK